MELSNNTLENTNNLREVEQEKMYVIVDYGQKYFECTTIGFKSLKRYYCTSNSH